MSAISTVKKVAAAGTLVGAAVVGYQTVKVIRKAYSEGNKIGIAGGVLMAFVAYAAIRYSVDALNE